MPTTRLLRAVAVAAGVGAFGALASLTGEMTSRMSEVASRSARSVRVGSVILHLTKTKHVDPIFPDAARRADGQVVVVEVVIGRDGRVQDATILRSIPELDRAALDAVRQWEYVPTYFAGEPIPVIAVVTVSFGKK